MHARDRRLHQKAACCFWSAKVASPGARSRVTEITGKREKTNFPTFGLRHAQGYVSYIAVGSVSAVTWDDIEWPVPSGEPGQLRHQSFKGGRPGIMVTIVSEEERGCRLHDENASWWPVRPYADGHFCFESSSWFVEFSQFHPCPALWENWSVQRAGWLLTEILEQDVNVTVLGNVFTRGVWVDSAMVWLNDRSRGFSYSWVWTSLRGFCTLNEC